MKTPRNYSELIKAWADGAEIEYKDLGAPWHVRPNPSWLGSGEYRIKPEPKEKQEPVAWVSDRGNFRVWWNDKFTHISQAPPNRTPLYTHPVKEWVGLTDEEIYGEGGKHERFAKDGSEWFDRGSFARAIESLLKEKNT